MLKVWQDSFLTFLGGLVLFVCGYGVGQSQFAPFNLVGAAGGTPYESQAAFEPFWEVWYLAHAQYYAQPLDEQKLVEGAIEGMLAALEDEHTGYMSPEEQAAMNDVMMGEIQGIGAEVAQNDDGSIVIVSPFAGSPAAEAGLRPQDILRQANGVELTGMAVGDAAGLVRGPAGTTVVLLVERDGETFELTVTRDVIKIPSITSEMLDHNLAYIRLNRFADNSGDEMEKTLQTVLGQNPAGLILDLRQNPGGGLTAVVDIGDQFLASGNILIEEFGDGSQTPYVAGADGLAQEIPLVILIDEGSASASEVLAGAIQDLDRGELIGATSFGKGTIQNWIPLGNGGGLRLTIAKWLTPNGRWVHETGVTPDQEVELSPEVLLGSPEDTQLQAAVDYLLGK